MQYINPIEILGLTNTTEIKTIDNEVVKKAKRKLFADIDLSDDGLYEYNGLKLTKGDCEKAINDFTNNKLTEFYLYLASNNKLNKFLVNGNEVVFANFKVDSIFNLPEFINFISPFFAPKFDKSLLKAFENEDVEKTKSILKFSLLISPSDLNIAFRGVSNNIQNKISEIDEITKDIKNEESNYDEDDIENVVDLVKEYFPTNTLNCLPQYFQSQVLKIAKSINYLSNAIWDAFDSTQVPYELTQYLLTLNIEGLERPIFENNLKIIKRKNDERNEKEKYGPVLKKYAEYLIQAKIKIQEIENKAIIPSSLLSWINSSISIPDINNLPSVFDEIKNQVALSLNAMSVLVWNSFYNIEVSIDLINKANNITGLNQEIKQKVKISKEKLFKLNVHSKKIKNSNIGCIWVIGTLGFLWLLGYVLFSDKLKLMRSQINESNYTEPFNNNIDQIDAKIKEMYWAYNESNPGEMPGLREFANQLAKDPKGVYDKAPKGLFIDYADFENKSGIKKNIGEVSNSIKDLFKTYNKFKPEYYLDEQDFADQLLKDPKGVYDNAPKGFFIDYTDFENIAGIKNSIGGESAFIKELFKAFNNLQPGFYVDEEDLAKTISKHPAQVYKYAPKGLFVNYADFQNKAGIKNIGGESASIKDLFKIINKLQPGIYVNEEDLAGQISKNPDQVYKYAPKGLFADYADFESKCGILKNIYEKEESNIKNKESDILSELSKYKTETNELNSKVDNHYKGNQLKDGASPLTSCFGKGIYSGNATLTIKNGGNSDAIVCLYSISDDRTIRNEYVRKNSKFTMSNIAQGYYKIRIFYGNDWNPVLVNSCGTKGNFESDLNFSEFDGTKYFEDSESGYTNATITLYTVVGGNASSTSIDKAKFFKK
jgi:hypothetical protein